jgi:hypothetical protein
MRPHDGRTAVGPTGPILPTSDSSAIDDDNAPRVQGALSSPPGPGRTSSRDHYAGPMGSWLLRGTCMALLISGIDVGLAALAAHQASSLGVLRPISLGVVIGVAAVWGALDTWLRIEYRGRNWVSAALVAGLLSGVLRVVGRAIFVDETELSALVTALTGDAAFTALIVLLPASIGVLIGGTFRPYQRKVRAVQGGATKSEMRA